MKDLFMFTPELLVIIPLIIVISVLGIAFVFLPTIVAVIRKHRQVVPILILNILLWWTFIAWALALAWAFVKEEKSCDPQPPPENIFTK